MVKMHNEGFNNDDDVFLSLKKVTQKQQTGAGTSSNTEPPPGCSSLPTWHLRPLHGDAVLPPSAPAACQRLENPERFNP